MLTPATQRQLYTLLAELYPDQASAVRIAQGAGIRTELVSWTNHVLNNWHAILQEAEKQDRLAQLMAVVDEEYGGNPRWNALKGEMPGLSFPSASLIKHAISTGQTPIGLLLIGLLVIVGFWVIMQTFAPTRSSTPTPVDTVATPMSQPTPSSFTYGVTVLDDDNRSIPDAHVLIEIKGQAPLDEYADENGYARIVVPATHAGQPGRITVNAPGYEVNITNLDLYPEHLPDSVRLTAKVVGNTSIEIATPNPTPQMLVATSTAAPLYTIITSVPTITPQPTNQSIPPMPQMLGFVSSYTPNDQVVNGQMIIHLMNTYSHQVTKIEPGFDPSWSPDRQLIAYGSSLGTISIMNADGSNSQIVTNQEDWQPSWSPDGNQIVFASARTGTRQIYVMDKNGQNQIRLTNHPFHDRHPDWAPDGTAIVFISNRTGRWQIWSMTSAGNNQIQLTDGEYNYYKPTWSPDGQKLIFGVWTGNRNEIWTMNKDGGDIRELITNSVYTLEGVGYGLSWSSNGWIAYVSDVDGRPQVYAKHITDQDVIRVTNGDTYDYFPVWIGE